MQNQKVKPEFVLISIPFDVIEEAALGEGEIIQITAQKGKIIIEAVDDTGDIVCDTACENCPVYETEGDNCPNKEYEYER